MPLVSERTPRWRNIVGMILLLAIFGIVLFVLRSSTSVQKAVNTSIDSSERADCRALISATFVEVRDRRENLAASLSQQAARAQIDNYAGIKPTPQTVALYSLTETQLATAIVAVENLPNLSMAVDHGWAPSDEAKTVLPSLPDRLPACPKVN